eukprot:TRINITY_DN40712_c0_g1_i1.p1 TRINITY_DN40712_c0_g1~~TRINITY_DN40712_c0_g1_i1.p1  ORF type:complete len:683 (+),score=91.65 TRINITY_DN40712_c0_g1_i1:232-2049(+)
MASASRELGEAGILELLESLAATDAGLHDSVTGLSGGDAPTPERLELGDSLVANGAGLQDSGTGLSGGYAPPVLIRESSAPPPLERILSATSRRILDEFVAWVRLHFPHSSPSSSQSSAAQKVDEAARLLLAISKASRRSLLSPDECAALREELLKGREEIVRDIITGVGVSAVDEKHTVSGGCSEWDCKICFTPQSSVWHAWACPQRHMFCRECMGHYTETQAFPRCPQAGCDYELREGDLIVLSASQQRLDAFRQAKLTNAIDTIGTSQEMLVRCTNHHCENVVVIPAGERRRCFSCRCGAAPFCTQCRQHPYHYYASCDGVQTLREQWIQWISGGRERYTGQVQQAAAADQRRRALNEAMDRHRELEADEQWKAENCRLCPSCQRPISKVAGCNDMICGRSYHGGDSQPGCGRRFNWATARPYTANVGRRRPETRIEDVQLRVRGRKSFHAFTDCSICGQQGIHGIRFRCIHCESMNVCSSCEPHLGDLHDVSHVFELMFESEFDWLGLGQLPLGTQIVLVRKGREMAQSHMEGLCGRLISHAGPSMYEVQLDRDQQSILINAKYVEPVLTSRESAQALLSQVLNARSPFGPNDDFLFAGLS